jgi:hypothetical protein
MNAPGVLNFHSKNTRCSLLVQGGSNMTGTDCITTWNSLKMLKLTHPEI